MTSRFVEKKNTRMTSGSFLRKFDKHLTILIINLNIPSFVPNYQGQLCYVTGLFLIYTLMDKVSYGSTKTENTLKLVKYNIPSV